MRERKKDELREVEAKVGIIRNADGSAMFRDGNTVVIAAVYGPRSLPKFMQDEKKARLRVYYNMATFSVPERKRPEPGRRDIELSEVIRRALESSIFLEKFPKTVIDVFILVVQADAGTRCAAINAASLALADAGIPMKGLVSAVAAGRANGEIILDLDKEEEDAEDAVDCPIAFFHNEKKITLIQMDGKIKLEDLKKVINLALKGCSKIYEIQKKALKERYGEEK